jgi:hypothetical protein
MTVAQASTVRNVEIIGWVAPQETSEIMSPTGPAFDPKVLELIRGYEPLADAEDYGRELIPRVRSIVAERSRRTP